MEAMRFHEYGDADVLRDEDVEVPVPGPDEVRIRVAATAFNPVDAGIRGGYLQAPFPVALPHVPRIDVSGTIDALGASVTGRRAGDRVIAFLPMIADGSAAEYVVAPAEILAKRAGAYVIRTASPRSAERVRAAGADEVIDRTATSVAEAVGRPVDVVLNLAPIAPAELATLAGLVGAGGVVLSTVPAAMPDETSGVGGGVRTVAVFARSDAHQLADLARLIDAGELHVDVAERISLSELRAVHARSNAGALRGKVVPTPAAA